MLSFDKYIYRVAYYTAKTGMLKLKHGCCLFGIYNVSPRMMSICTPQFLQCTDLAGFSSNITATDFADFRLAN